MPINPATAIAIGKIVGDFALILLDEGVEWVLKYQDVKRLDKEMQELRRLARKKRIPVGVWRKQVAEFMAEIEG